MIGPDKPMACMDCSNYIGELMCKAFPKGIPDKILDAKNSHTKPCLGDNGIMYDKIKE